MPTSMINIMNTEQETEAAAVTATDTQPFYYNAEEEGVSLLDSERRRGAQITQNEGANGDEEDGLSDQDFEQNEVDDGDTIGAPGEQRTRQAEPRGEGPNIVPASVTQQTPLSIPPVMYNPNAAAPGTPLPTNGGTHCLIIFF